MISQRSVLTAAGLAAVAALSLSGCSTATKEAATSATEKASSVAESAASSASSAVTSAMAAPAGGLVGAGCAAYAEANPTGPGSVAGLAAFQFDRGPSGWDSSAPAAAGDSSATITI